jgi:hypothetical protein
LSIVGRTLFPVDLLPSKRAWVDQLCLCRSGSAVTGFALRIPLDGAVSS